MPKHENNSSNGLGRHVEISLGLSVQLVDERTLNGENPFNGGRYYEGVELEQNKTKSLGASARNCDLLPNKFNDVRCR